MSVMERKPGDKKSYDERIRELTAERKQLRAEVAQLRSDCQELESKLSRLQPELTEREKLPERLAQAREEGRKQFPNFDAVVAAIPPELPEAELLYALGMGLQMIREAHRLHAQAQRDNERLAYYRELNRQHFSGEKTNGQPAASA